MINKPYQAKRLLNVLNENNVDSLLYVCNCMYEIFNLKGYLNTYECEGDSQELRESIKEELNTIISYNY